MINLLDEDIISPNPFTRLNIYCPDQPAHRHTFFEFVLVLNGNCRHSLNGSAMELLKQGTLLLIRPNEYHKIGFSGKDCIYRDYFCTVNEMKKICSAIGEGFYEELMNRKEPFKTTLTVNGFNSLTDKSAIFNNVNYTNKEPLRNLSQLHKTIIAELLGKFIEEKITGNTSVPDWLNDLYLHLTYFDYINLSVEEIVAKTGYTHGYVSQMFRKYFNTSIISYHNKNKVIYSCKLLGNMKIIDIASMLGWENPKNYAIEFRKVFNCSPTRYIKQMKSNYK